MKGQQEARRARFFFWWFASVCLSPVGAYASIEAPSVGTEVGQKYPEFAFPSLSEGRLTSLSELRGRKVLLIQFASW
jgi:hypothetical protein